MGNKMNTDRLVETRIIPDIDRRALLKTALVFPALPLVASCDTVREYTQKVIAVLTAFNSLIGGSNPAPGNALARIDLTNRHVPSTNGFFGTYLLAEKTYGGLDRAVREQAVGKYDGDIAATREIYLNNPEVAAIDFHETKSGEILRNLSKKYETTLNTQLKRGKYLLAYDTAEGFFVKPFTSNGANVINAIYIT